MYTHRFPLYKVLRKCGRLVHMLLRVLRIGVVRLSLIFYTVFCRKLHLGLIRLLEYNCACSLPRSRGSAARFGSRLSYHFLHRSCLFRLLRYRKLSQFAGRIALQASLGDVVGYHHVCFRLLGTIVFWLWW